MSPWLEPRPKPGLIGRLSASTSLAYDLASVAFTLVAAPIILWAVDVILS